MKRLFILCLVGLSLTCISAKGAVYASGYVLMEASSKRVLDGKNINTRYLTASICKILTAIIVIEKTDIDGYIVITADDCNQIGSAIYMEPGDVIKIRDLLYGLMLRSGNDCANALARYTCGSVKEFINLMNTYAKRIGMKHSTFANPSGLDEETQNYSTAYDMALLMIYAMENPVFREINNTNKYTFKSINEKHYLLYNKHKLITGYDYIIGGKTGYTINAKRTLVTYATKNGVELVCVTFNCGDDWNVHTNLFDYGFSRYTMTTVMRSQTIEAKRDYKVTPYLNEDIVLPLMKSEKVALRIYLLNEEHIISNIVGKVVVYIDGVEVCEKLLYRYY